MNALVLHGCTRGAPDLDPDLGGYPEFFQDPNSLDPVNRIHYHVVVPITVSMNWFLPTRRYASAGYRDRNVSVCPSVCHALVLCQNEES